MSREFHSSMVFILEKSGHFCIQIFFGQQYLEKIGAQFQRANFQGAHLYHLGSSSEYSVWSISSIQIEQRTSGFRSLRNF